MPQDQKNRPDLIGEHPVGDAGQLIFAALFFVVWIADSFFLKWTTFLSVSIQLAARLPVFVALLITGGWFARSTMKTVFGEVREPPAVIRKGLFNLVRHPMYLSEVLTYLGFTLLSCSLTSLAVTLASWVFLHFISRHEEKMLLARFGEDYGRYLREVPMWIPFTKGRAKK